MRRLFGGLLVLLFVLVPATAHADAVGETQEIQIHATVLPARSIILDPQGRISQILSNTAENVTPSVYRGSIAAGHEIQLSGQLLTQYSLLLAQVARPGPGVLYKQPELLATPANLATKQQPTFLSILLHVPSS